MTEIDVPDWVVEEACAKLAVGMEFEGKWPEDDQDEAGDELREAMRAALTAALGAWVVARAWAGTDFPNWRRHESEQVRKLTRKAQPQHGFITPLYTLRQEKPDVLP